MTAKRRAASRKGYAETEIVGQHFSKFFTPDERVADKPASALKTAAETGRWKDEGLAHPQGRSVAREAACSLGRMGKIEVRPILLRLLQQAPSAEAIDAISPIADEECLIILGRIARTRPDLADAALLALESVGSPGALKIATASCRPLGTSVTSSD